MFKNLRHIGLFACLALGACAPSLPENAPVTEAPFSAALAYVTEQTVDQWYEDHGIEKAERTRMNGNRPNCVQGEMNYKVRPLQGVWATAPFLHNGSVPNLYSLLSPASDRPKKFCLGNRQCDPKLVGYSTDCASGDFELDTSIPGNRNTGPTNSRTARAAKAWSAGRSAPTSAGPSSNT